MLPLLTSNPLLTEITDIQVPINIQLKSSKENNVWLIKKLNSVRADRRWSFACWNHFFFIEVHKSTEFILCLVKHEHN